jgi:hypothetical protein
MIRRWSYIASDNIEQNHMKMSLKPILIKKGFKQTVRFKKNHFKITKILKKRYSTRKIKNSNFGLITNAFLWSRFYIYSSNYEKKSQYKYALPSKINANPQNIESFLQASSKNSLVKFKIFNAKNKKEVNLIKVLGKHAFFTDMVNYSNLIANSWSYELIKTNYLTLLSVRSILVLNVLLHAL